MNPRSGALGVLATVLCLLAVLTGCAGKQRTTTGSPVTDGRLTVAVEFGPKAGFAIDTDDAFMLTELGVVETLGGCLLDTARSDLRQAISLLVSGTFQSFDTPYTTPPGERARLVSGKC